MFKKAFQVALTFALLLAGYAGYARVFALVATQIQSTEVAPVPHFVARRFKSFEEAIALAERAFGRGHWSADRSLEMFRFYNADRGYWMYAKNYERQKGGKLLIFEPFALIWVSRDGKDLKTATSDKAIVLLDQPFDVVIKPGAGSDLHVINARLEGNVQLRDDKGTPEPADDLRISGREGQGLTYVEYDEAKQRITHDSHVTIEDGDMRVSGKDIEIQLRAKDAAPGKTASYSGAQTIYLRKDVHIIIKDVGRSGVLPGTAPVAPKQGASTPLDLRCDGLARFDLPKPSEPLPRFIAGPPAPTLPTFAHFDRNVEVVRGRPGELQDRLLCDHLRLTFLPDDNPAPAARPDGSTEVEVTAQRTPARDPGSPMGGLALREAHATGHAVELMSPAQGLKVRQCNELIYKKQPGAKPGETDDETYLRTDLTQKLLVEKVEIPTEGPDKGKITSVTHVRCVDATIFQHGADSDRATIVARGPGILETRPALDAPVERTALWNDQLDIVPVHSAEGQLLKRITLTDAPKFRDIQAKTTLDARRMLVVYLRPKAADPAKPATKATGSGAANASDSFEIHCLRAFEDVHLNAPGRRLTAVEQLDAYFVPGTPAQPAAPAVGPDGKPAFVVAADPFAEENAAPADKRAEPAEKPPGPDVFVKANHVQANIVMRPADQPQAAGGKGRRSAGSQDTQAEVQRVYLTGAVSFHQDPAPGETQGTDVTGEVCDGRNAGNGLWQFSVYDQSPTPDRVFPTGRAAGQSPIALPPARVANKDMTIEGPTIGLDQPADAAWVYGPGKLVMLTERDLLSEEETPAPGGAREKAGVRVVPVSLPEAPREASRGNAKAAAKGKDKEKPAARKVPVTITWTGEMRFYGQSQDPSGRPTARAEFMSDPADPRPPGSNKPAMTKAETENGMLVCQDMKVYFDRPIKLAKLRQAPGAQAPNAEPEPKHEIDFIECFDNVIAIARKVENFETLQQQRVEGQQLTYDRVTGHFHVPGEGKVFYWNRAGAGDASAPGAAPQPSRVITRSSKPTRRDDAKKAAPKRADRPAAPLGRLELTVVRFDQGMQGRVLAGKENAQEPRTADFFGNVEALHAPVASTRDQFDFDHPPRDFAHMTAQTMRLISEPPTATDPPGTPARTFMQAFVNAYAHREAATIQADKITYDSEKDLFWAYGYDGRDVVIQQQKGIGQPPSTTQGKAAYYIHKTGQAKVIDPKSVQLIDQAFAKRPTPDKPTTNKPPARPKRSRNTKPNSIERKSFNGR